MGTTLSDIIVPELFNPYVIQKTLGKIGTCTKRYSAE